MSTIKLVTQVRLAIHAGDVIRLQHIFRSGKKVSQDMFDYAVNNSESEAIVEAFINEGFKPTAKTLDMAFWHSNTRLAYVIKHFKGKISDALIMQCLAYEDAAALEIFLDYGFKVTTTMVQTAIWNNLGLITYLLLGQYKGKYNFREELIFAKMANRPIDEVKEHVHHHSPETKTILTVVKATEDMEWVR